MDSLAPHGRQGRRAERRRSGLHPAGRQRGRPGVPGGAGPGVQGRRAASGYTEPLLHAWRQAKVTPKPPQAAAAPRAHRDELRHAQRFGAARCGVDAERVQRLPSAPGTPLRLCRSILRRWPKAASVTRSSIRARDALGHRGGLDVDDRAHHLGRRGEGAAVDLHRQLRACCATAPAPPAGRRRRYRARRRCAGRLPAGTSASGWSSAAAMPRPPSQRDEQRGADVVGQVGDDRVGLVHQRVVVELQRVALDHAQPAGKGFARVRRARAGSGGPSRSR